MSRILIYGYGNPGRQDDGLGVQLAEKIDAWAKEMGYEDIVVDTNYQLNIEDAYELNKYDAVIFADASMEDISNYKFEELKPRMEPNFTMHSVSASFVLGLCQEIYNETPRAYLLHIKGYTWDFMKELSGGAKTNLDSSFEYLKRKIELMMVEKVA